VNAVDGVMGKLIAESISTYHTSLMSTNDFHALLKTQPLFFAEISLHKVRNHKGQTCEDTECRQKVMVPVVGGDIITWLLLLSEMPYLYRVLIKSEASFVGVVIRRP
jgi:hypothetical protein